MFNAERCPTQTARRKAQDRKQQQGTAFLWRDRKNNPQENCSGWIKDLESKKADCCKRVA